MHDYYTVFEQADLEFTQVRKENTKKISDRWERYLESEKGRRSARIKNRRLKDRGPQEATTRPGDTRGEYLSKLWREQQRLEQSLMEQDTEAALAAKL